MKLIINKEQAHLIYESLEIQKAEVHRQIKAMTKLVDDANPVLKYAYTKYGQLGDLMEAIDLGIIIKE